MIYLGLFGFLGKGAQTHMRRYAQVIGVKRERIAAYEQMHAQVWPEVLEMIYACNIRNYSIFRYQTVLISYFEDVGEDFDADMQRIAADPKRHEWWAITDPMQEPLSGRAAREWWMRMAEVFHTD